MNGTPKTLQEAIVHFANKDNAFEFVKEFRWPNGPACPVCGCNELYFLSTRHLWKCKACKKQFSVKVGTIFEDSSIGLDKWLTAIWLIVNAKNGISSYELARAIGVQQRSAWHMNHRIRLALQNGTFEKLEGKVEADETYIGGKARNMHHSARVRRGFIASRGGSFGKSAVIGMLERGGKVRAQVIEKADRKTVTKIVMKNVDEDSKLFTDAHSGYDDLGFYYQRHVIEHASEYVRGSVHTNGIENFWSLLKRGLNGTYISVEPFHLFRYIDEQVFRFNLRKEDDSTRFEKAVSQIVGKKLTYAALTGKELLKGA